MKYLKDPITGEVFAYEADGSQDAYIKPGLVPMDVEQVATHLTPLVTLAALCISIDTAVDAARRAVAGDPLRAVEYDRARLQAEQFAAADYQGEVPAMVAAWAINGRTPQQAADSILAEAAAYTNALELLRTTRLAAKSSVWSSKNATAKRS